MIGIYIRLFSWFLKLFNTETREKRKKSSLKMNSFILISQINQKTLKMLIGDVPIDLAEWKQGQAILQLPGITALFSLQDKMSLQ